ncbi:hypothetical protein GTY86_05775 [Streptomyces sp. SID5770]|uniref:hypothetical protein n=1 Tax=Streptomyces sp. SID5770 TaxID=2690308 RepID=UPI00137143F1|nr:hypothetical protein [Streptomyces sp. SID5770]
MERPGATASFTTDQPVLVRAAEAGTPQDGALSRITPLADSPDTGGASTAHGATSRKGPPGAPAHFRARATGMIVVFTAGTDRFDHCRPLERVHRGEAIMQEVKDSSGQFDDNCFQSPVWQRGPSDR